MAKGNQFLKPDNKAGNNADYEDIAPIGAKDCRRKVGGGINDKRHNRVKR